LPGTESKCDGYNTALGDAARVGRQPASDEPVPQGSDVSVDGLKRVARVCLREILQPQSR
jgi:hypothetical protein